MGGSDPVFPTIQFCKVRNVKSPKRGGPFEAGIDFFIPEDFGPFDLMPHERVLVESGIHVRVPHGYMLKAEDKSGVGVKKGLKYLGGVIDETYQGEVGICMFNTSDITVTLNPGEKVIQFILIPVGYHVPEELESVEELYSGLISYRGQMGFGDLTGQD